MLRIGPDGASKKMTSLGKMGLPARGEPSGAAGRIKTCKFQLCRALVASAKSSSGSSRAAIDSQVSLGSGSVLFRCVESADAMLRYIPFKFRRYKLLHDGRVRKRYRSPLKSPACSPKGGLYAKNLWRT